MPNIQSADLFSSIISAAAKAPIDKSITSKNHRIHATGNRKCLLIDCSGSMSEKVAGIQKIEMLRSAIMDLNLSEWVIFAFSDDTKMISTSCIPEPSGSTNLAAAIRAARDFQPRETLIISDGIPDSEDEALKEAIALPGTISTLYVGSDRFTEAIAFLNRLARLGCGKAHVRDLSKGMPALKSSLNILTGGA